MMRLVMWLVMRLMVLLRLLLMMRLMMVLLRLLLVHVLVLMLVVVVNRIALLVVPHPPASCPRPHRGLHRRMRSVLEAAQRWRCRRRRRRWHSPAELCAVVPRWCLAQHLPYLHQDLS